MKNLMKMIVIAAVAALLICMVITCASADEKIYTSPVFRLPKDRLNSWLEVRNETETDTAEPAGEEQEEPAEEEPETTEEPLNQDEQETEPEEPAEIQREVRIYSTQRAVVKINETIELSSVLIGFDEDEEVIYQWQVDRDDGLGWVDVKNATESTYQYLANPDTIRYKWRLIVDVAE